MWRLPQQQQQHQHQWLTAPLCGNSAPSAVWQAKTHCSCDSFGDNTWNKSPSSQVAAISPLRWGVSVWKEPLIASLTSAICSELCCSFSSSRGETLCWSFCSVLSLKPFLVDIFSCCCCKFVLRPEYRSRCLAPERLCARALGLKLWFPSSAFLTVFQVLCLLCLWLSLHCCQVLVQLGG